MAKQARKLAAILAADVVGYSRLMGQDEEGTWGRVRALRTERLEPALAQNGGRLFKLIGDGALAEFPSAVDALRAAIEFQQAMAVANKDLDEAHRMVFRIGLHLGDVIVDGDDRFGDAVNVAARLEGQARPGGIAVSGNFRDSVANAKRLKATFEDGGAVPLKNIEGPLKLFHVQWDPADWTPPPVSNGLSGWLRHFKVDAIRLEGVFLGAEALPPERIIGRYVPGLRRYPEGLEQAFERAVDAQQRSAERLGKSFDNNGTYSLGRMSVRRPEGLRGGRANIYHFDFHESDYSRFVVPNSILDTVLGDPGAWTARTWREATGLQREVLRFSELERLPFHFRVGVNGIFVTRDGFVVVTFRAWRQLIAGGSTETGEIVAHASIAEGMFRSDVDDKESDTLDGAPHPFATLLRAARDELGLRPEDIVRESCRCIVFAMDQLRAQPLFVFRADLAVTLEQAMDSWEESGDRHENDFIAGLPWNTTTVAGLMEGARLSELDGRFPPDLEAMARTGLRIRLASNHAQLSFLAAACDAQRGGAERWSSLFARGQDGTLAPPGRFA